MVFNKKIEINKAWCKKQNKISTKIWNFQHMKELSSAPADNKLDTMAKNINKGILHFQIWHKEKVYMF